MKDFHLTICSQILISVANCGFLPIITARIQKQPRTLKKSMQTTHTPALDTSTLTFRSAVVVLVKIILLGWVAKASRSGIFSKRESIAATNTSQHPKNVLMKMKANLNLKQDMAGIIGRGTKKTYQMVKHTQLFTITPFILICTQAPVSMGRTILRIWPRTKILFGSTYTRIILRDAANIGLEMLRLKVV